MKLLALIAPTQTCLCQLDSPNNKMKIKSVVRKIVIVINGVEHVVSECDWTESIDEANEDGMIENNKDIIDWIEEV